MREHVGIDDVHYQTRNASTSELYIGLLLTQVLSLTKSQEVHIMWRDDQSYSCQIASCHAATTFNIPEREGKDVKTSGEYSFRFLLWESVVLEEWEMSPGVGRQLSSEVRQFGTGPGLTLLSAGLLLPTDTHISALYFTRENTTFVDTWCWRFDITFWNTFLSKWWPFWVLEYHHSN